MSTSVSSRTLLPATRDIRTLLIKWVVALLVPVAVFTFIWSGEAIVNNVLLGLLAPGSNSYSSLALILTAIFIILFYGAIIALVGYLMAADSGQRSIVDLWLDILFFTVIPLIIVDVTGLIIGLAISVLVWAVYFYVRNRIRTMRRAPAVPVEPLANIQVLDAEHRAALMNRATLGGFWFGSVFAVIWLIIDLLFFFTGTLPTILLIWVVARTILLPIAGYFLGRLGGAIALRYTLSKANGSNGNGSGGLNVSKKKELEVLSATRAREEAKDIVPNDLPLRSAGAQRFYLLLLVAFVLFYPVLDPFLFGSGTNGRISGYADAGYYIILALGLNIVVGFAGLLDLGYVAFFAIGSYAWGMFGSTQFTTLTGIVTNPHVVSWLFWPVIILAALITASFGILLGAPTLRLRGDYLAIVTLGFGEIVPIVFLELDKYTNGANGIVGVYSPAFFGIDWSAFTPIPYYYLILALIALVVFANVRLRDSRLGRAWIAIREDEIAASSSGVNLVNTKLLAFASGAFFAGLAGAFHAAKLAGVSPDQFSFGDSIVYLAMVVIGGIGSIPGVIVGAIAVYAINQLILAQLDSLGADPTSFFHPIYAAITSAIPGFTFGNIRNLIFGVILVAIMIFRPEGLIPSARRRRELRSIESGAEVEMGALDIAPGAPGFESEVRVE